MATFDSFQKGKKANGIREVRKQAMTKKKISCKTGLRKSVISRHIFKKELELCRQLSKKGKGKCGWGTCKNCGVIPLLHKLHRGELLEDEKEIKSIKKEIIS